MANEDVAVNYVLAWEDASMSGKVTTDRGGCTRWGIAEKFHPELTNSGFYTEMSATASLIVARGIYEKEYCQPLCIAQMSDQRVANKMLSLGVNIGVGTASRMLQDVLHVVGDGRIGPLTLDKLEQADPLEVLADLSALASAHYREIVAEDPSQAKYLDGWLRRANA